MDDAGQAPIPSPAPLIMDCLTIQAYLPHRDPFLFVDRIIELEPYKRAIGLKNVTSNEPYFRGHFPERPVMPGVLIVEAMAQTAAVLVVRTLGASAAGKLVYFMSIDHARFRRPVTPGDQLRIYVVKERSRANVWKFTGEAKVDGRLVAEATYAAMLMDR